MKNEPCVLTLSAGAGRLAQYEVSTRPENGDNAVYACHPLGDAPVIYCLRQSTDFVVSLSDEQSAALEAALGSAQLDGILACGANDTIGQAVDLRPRRRCDL